jgi:hypothetical protein
MGVVRNTQSPPVSGSVFAVFIVEDVKYTTFEIIFTFPDEL